MRVFDICLKKKQEAEYKRHVSNPLNVYNVFAWNTRLPCANQLILLWIKTKHDQLNQVLYFTVTLLQCISVCVNEEISPSLPGVDMAVVYCMLKVIWDCMNNGIVERTVAASASHTDTVLYRLVPCKILDPPRVRGLGWDKLTWRSSLFLKYTDE